MVLEWVYIGDIEYILKHLCQPTEEIHIIVYDSLNLPQPRDIEQMKKIANEYLKPLNLKLIKYMTTNHWMPAETLIDIYSGCA